MTSFYHISGLKREFHHIKVLGDNNQEEYQPCMGIFNHRKKGRSFYITQAALWKYVEPLDNLDALPWDVKSFARIVNNAMKIMEWTAGVAPHPPMRMKAKQDLADCAMAEAIYRDTKILPTVCYNLVKCLRMMEIAVNPQSAAQLLLFIQEGLDELKNMPPAPYEEDQLHAGEVSLWDGGTKIGTQEVTMSESDLMTDIDYPDNVS